MKILKTLLLTSSIATASLAQAELTANFPLDGARANYDLMHPSQLISYARQGNPDAEFYLAKRLQKGLGMAKNPQQAIEWYTKAANQNITPAQLNLGLMYVFGDGVRPDAQKARYWLEKAAKRGDNRASYTLAMLDEKQHRLVDAYKWYDLASRDGMLNEAVRNKARRKIGKLALNLSNADISNARRLADSWFQQ